MPNKLYLVLDNLRSSHNVGALLRTAEGLGVDKVIMCGITPYPKLASEDNRPPYLTEKVTRRIVKTSLGAEQTIDYSYVKTTADALSELKQQGFKIIALEQNPSAIPITKFTKPIADLALVVGNEVDGVSNESLKLSDETIQIPMSGSKESFNVASAAAMALFYLTLML